MRNLLFLPAAALAAAVLPAQPDHFTTSPTGYESVEGGLSNSVIGQAAMLRFQQIDATIYGSKANRNRWAFRRDGLLPDNLQYAGRNVEMEFVCAESDLGSASTTFDDNYVAGTSAIVFTKKTIAFPDWTVAPVTAPATEDLIIPFDTLSTYNGKAVTGTDMLWEVRIYSNDGAGSPYPMDADIVIPTHLSGVSSALGTGCTSPGQSGAMNQHFTIDNYGTKYALHTDVSRAAPGAPAALFFGTPQQIPLPGYCTNLEVLPLVTIPMGLTDPTGFAQLTIDPIGYNAAYIGGTIAGQTVVLDTGLFGGVGLSQGHSAVIPANPPTTPQVAHLYAPDPAAATATSGVINGGIIGYSNHP